MMLELNKIYNMDCMEGMKQIPDNYTDLVLTDPPYGITKESWDILPSNECFNQLFRVSKKQIIFGGHFFNLPKKNGWIIWNKLPFLKTGNECELLWTSFLKKNIIIDFRYAGNVIGNTLKPNYKRKKAYFTSQKPVEFLELLLNKYSKINDIILDCFTGSGSCYIACKNLNRRFIGFENKLNLKG